MCRPRTQRGGMLIFLDLGVERGAHRQTRLACGLETALWAAGLEHMCSYRLYRQLVEL